jgi:hypothetical protein
MHTRPGRSAIPLCLAAISALPAFAQVDSAKSVLGYINHIPPESPEAAKLRHDAVARRRAGTPILTHRGARDAAPENTLEAYKATMDWGADGCEIDIRRSKDGVLYLHHDDDLGRMLAGSGRIKDLTYYEILALPMKRHGTADKNTRVPTLAAFLVLARQRAMLIHLDVKEPGLQDEIARMFDEADMWDHIVEVNGGNAERLRPHAKVKLLPYKGWWPEGKYADDPDAIRDFLSKPGQMVFTKDPRSAVKALRRGKSETKPESSHARTALPFPEGIRTLWSAAGIVQTQPGQ